MADQTIIQIRVDNSLKDQVNEVFDEIGVDIPTAVRMFFKAAVRERRLPFSTELGKTAQQSEQEGEELIRAFKDIVIYTPPISNPDTVVVLPLEMGGVIPREMFLQLISKVLAGKVCCWEDVFAFLSKIYKREVTQLPDQPFQMQDADGNFISFMRVVTDRGILTGGRWNDREKQRELLLEEGVPVVQRGSIPGSYKVDNYKTYMFNFDSLRVSKNE